MNNKRKFNYKKFILFCLVVLLILVYSTYGIITLINKSNYKKSYEYKFVTLGYSIDEFNIIKDKINEKDYEKLLNYEYSDFISSLIKEKYFLFKNLDKYISYYEEYNLKDISKLVSIINTKGNIDYLDEEYETNTSLNELMLINRLYGLSSDYEIDDIVEVPVRIAYGGNKIRESIINDIDDLISFGKENNYNFVVSGGYRTYEDQEKLYNSYVSSYGQSEADEVVAKPGHSEYESGYTFDLQPYNTVVDNPFESEEYKWLKNNSYKYGFIVRFEKGKEDITRFNSSAWRLRYVGKEAAKKIYEENITFDEYYEYYVIGEKDE